jgi:hypothetical protein
MGKRSLFPRFPRDAYPTPAEAVAPLTPHLEPNIRFVEPCAGAGDLVGHLQRAGHVLVGAYEPDDARTKRYTEARDGVIFISNPPWSRDILHPIILNLSDQAPTWLLIAAGWAHTRQSGLYLPRLRTIVSVGRVKWIKDSPFTGKEDCAWHFFGLPQAGEPAITHFIGRTDSMRRAA